jgi:hypothetical protein
LLARLHNHNQHRQRRSSVNSSKYAKKIARGAEIKGRSVRNFFME